MDHEDSENSIRNFINDTKKLQKQTTNVKPPVINHLGKKEENKNSYMRMQSEYQDTRKKENENKDSQVKKMAFLKTYTLENNDFNSNKKNNVNKFYMFLL